MIMINSPTEIDPETITTGTMTGAASVPIIIRVITSKVSTNSMIEVREASEEDTTTEIIEVTIEITEVMINITNGKEEVIEMVEMIIGGKIEVGIITTEEITEIMMKTPSPVILMAKIPDPLSTVKKIPEFSQTVLKRCSGDEQLVICIEIFQSPQVQTQIL